VDYLYDLSDHVVAEVNSAGGVNREEVFINDKHVVTYANNTTYFDHADWLATERARSDVNGNLCETITSLPFGDWQSTNGSCSDVSPLHFTGQQRDTEIVPNLDYFHARYFASQFGRFDSPDPYNAGASPLDPQTWNMYSYVRNNPLSLIDPTGMQQEGDLNPCNIQENLQNDNGPSTDCSGGDSSDNGSAGPCPPGRLANICANFMIFDPTLSRGPIPSPSQAPANSGNWFSSMSSPLSLLKAKLAGAQTRTPTSNQSYRQCMASFQNSTLGKVVQFGSLLSFFDNPLGTVKEWTAAFAIKGGYLKIAETAGQSLQSAGEVTPITSAVKPLVGDAAALGVGAATTADAAARLGCSQSNPGNLLGMGSPILP
jgi:RHS repeat-associated protein